MAEASDEPDRVIAPVPRDHHPGVLRDRQTSPQAIEAAAGDRRMQKAHVKIQMGGGAGRRRSLSRTRRRRT